MTEAVTHYTEATLPSWGACKVAVEMGFATALAEFIYTEQPCDTIDAEWRSLLIRVLNEERKAAVHSVNKE